MDLIISLCSILIGLFFYFIPSTVANIRNHSKFTSILILNVFLGWTFLGWVVALVWACTENNETMERS